MVWKVPRDLPLNEPVHDIDLEGIERASRALLNSTYKTDYLGLSQGKRHLLQSLPKVLKHL